MAGVRVGTEEIPTQLVIGADGRHSSVRRLAGLEVEALGAPIDVLWFRLARKAGDPATSMGRFDAGVALVLINRREYWQCGYVIPKGAAEKVRAAGLAAFRATLGRLLPWSVDRVGELADWQQVKLLTVQIDRLRRWWRPGLLCIGDAAHAMSPLAGWASTSLSRTRWRLPIFYRSGDFSDGRLNAVQRRREWPMKVTQRLQILAQDRLITPVLQSRQPIAPPRFFRWATRYPRLARIPGRLIGMGVRPEHVAPLR